MIVMLQCFIVLNLLFICMSAGELTCKSISEHAILKGNIEILCILTNNTFCLNDADDRLWTRGTEEQILLMNGYPIKDRSQKFKEQILTCNETSIVLSNLTEEDMDMTYKFSVNHLRFSLHASRQVLNFEYFPQGDEIKKQINVTSNSLTVFVEMRKVFPKLNCSFFIENHFSSSSMNHSTVLKDKFYSMMYNTTLSFYNLKSCPFKIRMECPIGTKSLTILNETVRNCTDEDSQDWHKAFFYSAVWLLSSALCVSVLVWSVYRNRKDLFELIRELPNRQVHQLRRPVIAFSLSLICIIVSTVYGWMTFIELVKTLITRKIVSYTRAASVGILISLGLMTSLDLCFISNPKTIGIRDGFKRAGINFYERIRSVMKYRKCNRIYRSVNITEIEVQLTMENGDIDVT